APSMRILARAPSTSARTRKRSLQRKKLIPMGPAGPNPPIVLGMDPSTRAFGWAVLQKDEVIAFGEITPKGGKNRIDRLTYIYNELESILDRYQPDMASAEDTFVWGKNFDTAMR